ncbi:hypothetical protein CFOL_v3_00191 [Cephalotus follicularis]|uniref:Reverse transcriptase RNase H-like domain-containing protein n=1 Tax=Cephalotus follicularis TaxID=3775 RepID=A0A1Q3ALM8_CEPFO|nr:hypothetical protein CFOL_v3_00191 [Cephalotus follicularis]
MQGHPYSNTPPLISKPKDGESLYLYLAAAPGAVSAVLVREEEQVQRPVYYVSKALNDAEGRYPEVEKFAYALIIAARKLRPYFQAHAIKVLTDQPLKQVLSKPDTSGRLIKWSVELGEYDVKFEARPMIKSQVLTDFVGDNTPTECMVENPSESERESWKLSVDGSSCITGSGVGVLLVSPSGWTVTPGPSPAGIRHARYEAKSPIRDSPRRFSRTEFQKSCKSPKYYKILLLGLVIIFPLFGLDPNL